MLFLHTTYGSFGSFDAVPNCGSHLLVSQICLSVLYAFLLTVPPFMLLPQPILHNAKGELLSTSGWCS